MFPLLISLLDLNDMSKESAVNFRESNFIFNHCIDPILFVLKRKINNESSALCEILLQLIIYQIKHILFVNRFS